LSPDSYKKVTTQDVTLFVPPHPTHRGKECLVASYENIEPSSGSSPGGQEELWALYAALDVEDCDEATIFTRMVGAITVVVVTVAGWVWIGSLLLRILR
jgi:hypothetical protein